MSDHKVFDPSVKKRKEVRKKGKVIKSQILTQSFGFFMVLLCIINGLAYLWINNQHMLEWCLSVPSEHLAACTSSIGSQTFLVLFISLASGAVAVLIAEVCQVKVEFFWEPICFQFERLSPMSGFKRITQGIAKSWLLILKLILVLMLAKYFILEFSELAHASFLTPRSGQSVVLLKELIRIVYLCSALLLFFGAIEYLFNRKRFMKENSMSLDEMRREHKEEEGDPHVRSHRKALHEAMVMQEMVKRVRSSKVIIVM